MSDYITNRAWSDQFLPEIKSILEAQFSGHKFVEGDIDEDRNECCDLKSMSDNLIISLRVRASKFYPKCINEILLSEKLNKKAEIEKIVEGYSRYYFYGFSHESDIKLVAWRIYDLNVFRLGVYNYLINNQGILPGIVDHKTNDPNSLFRIIDTNIFQNIKVVEYTTNKYNPIRIPSTQIK